MKHLPIKLILSLITSALFCTCSKDKLSPLEQLPPITSRGANTFGCLVNGEPVVFTGIDQISGAFLGDVDGTGNHPFDSSDIWLVCKNGRHSVGLFLNNPGIKNKWALNRRTLEYPVQNNPEDFIRVNNFLTSDNTIGFFESGNFDNTKPIFSGTFEFECINLKDCQTMKVTNGRVDINLNQLKFPD